MAIIPSVIEKKVFQKGFRGYVPEKVDEFLDGIILAYEKLHKENVLLKGQNVALAESNVSFQDEVRELNGIIKRYKAMEGAIQSALVTSEKMSEDIQKRAIEKAEFIESESRRMAKEIIEIAEQERQSIVSKVFKPIADNGV